MDKSEVLQKTTDFIRLEFAREGSGHDWFHVDRVRKMALLIGQTERCDLFVVEMAALLHDLDDWKLTGHQSQFPSKAKKWLIDLNVEENISAQILKVIEQVSFKGAAVETPVGSAEAATVQDADRLDAIGAIGIARTFSYGGHKNRLIYDPSVNPELHSDFQSYKNSDAPTVNHFFEKLLLLKDRMNTTKARGIAEQRHKFMEHYLEQFFDEWEARK